MRVDTVSCGDWGPDRKGGNPGLYRARIWVEKGKSGGGGEVGAVINGGERLLEKFQMIEHFTNFV